MTRDPLPQTGCGACPSRRNVRRRRGGNAFGGGRWRGIRSRSGRSVHHVDTVGGRDDTPARSLDTHRRRPVIHQRPVRVDGQERRVHSGHQDRSGHSGRRGGRVVSQSMSRAAGQRSHVGGDGSRACRDGNRVSWDGEGICRDGHRWSFGGEWFEGRLVRGSRGRHGVGRGRRTDNRSRTAVVIGQSHTEQAGRRRSENQHSRAGRARSHGFHTSDPHGRPTPLVRLPDYQGQPNIRTLSNGRATGLTTRSAQSRRVTSYTDILQRLWVGSRVSSDRRPN